MCRFECLAPPCQAVAPRTVAIIAAFLLTTVTRVVADGPLTGSVMLPFVEPVSLASAGPFVPVSGLRARFTRLLAGVASLLERFGLRAPWRQQRAHRPEEIELLLTQSYEHGLLREEPAEMIRGVFDLSQTHASEVMTPRTSVIALPVETPLEEAADFILDNGHSRYPVYEGSIDHVIGIVLARDVWQLLRRGGGALREATREALYVPDTKSVEQLLRDMQRDRTHMAIVIDEFGGTAGVVTMEDLVEEVVGEISDETDEEEPSVDTLPDGTVHCHGGVAIADLNALFGLQLPDEDYTTVGGFVLGRLGRLPRVGDEVEIRGGRLHVLAVSGRRIARLSLRLAPPVPVDDEAEGADGVEHESIE